MNSKAMFWKSGLRLIFILFLFTLVVKGVSAADVNVSNYTPSDLDFSVLNGTTINFTVNATGGNGTITYGWFLDTVLQAITNFWNWVTDASDLGNHNVTAVVSDNGTNTTDSVTWDVGVVEFIPNLTGVSPNFGYFDYMTPISCNKGNDELLNTIYTAEVNNSVGGWDKIFNNSFGIGFFDFSNITYNSSVQIRCFSSIDINGTITNSSFVYSEELYRKRAFNLILFESSAPPFHLPYQSYQFGIRSDLGNDSGVFFENAFIDCNGDNIWDDMIDSNYTYFNISAVSNFTDFFWCSFPNRQIGITVGVTVTKTTSTWSDNFRSCDVVTGDSCVISKFYPVYITEVIE